MGHSRYTSDYIAKRGQSLYDTQIRAQVEREGVGKYVVIDIETGEYEVGGDRLSAVDRAKARNPGAALYLLRVGYPAVVRVGGRLEVQRA